MLRPKGFVVFAVWVAVAGSWPAAGQSPGAVRVQGQEQPNQPEGAAGTAPGSTLSTPDLSSPAPGTPVPGKVRVQPPQGLGFKGERLWISTVLNNTK